jgi:hypothetical protein
MPARLFRRKPLVGELGSQPSNHVGKNWQAVYKVQIHRQVHRNVSADIPWFPQITEQMLASEQVEKKNAHLPSINAIEVDDGVVGAVNDAAFTRGWIAMHFWWKPHSKSSVRLTMREVLDRSEHTDLSEEIGYMKHAVGV